MGTTWPQHSSFITSIQNQKQQLQLQEKQNQIQLQTSYYHQQQYRIQRFNQQNQQQQLLLKKHKKNIIIIKKNYQSYIVTKRKLNINKNDKNTKKEEKRKISSTEILAKTTRTGNSSNIQQTTRQNQKHYTRVHLLKRRTREKNLKQKIIWRKIQTTLLVKRKIRYTLAKKTLIQKLCSSLSKNSSSSKNINNYNKYGLSQYRKRKTALTTTSLCRQQKLQQEQQTKQQQQVQNKYFIQMMLLWLMVVAAINGNKKLQQKQNNSTNIQQTLTAESYIQHKQQENVFVVNLYPQTYTSTTTTATAITNATKTEAEATPGQYNNNKKTKQANNYNYYYNNVSIHDYKGIEEFKIHTKQQNNYNNYYKNYNCNKNNTKMPTTTTTNNNKIILKNKTIFSASGPFKTNKNVNGDDDYCYLQKPTTSTTKNETTKCCQTNVAKQCCHSNFNKITTKNTILQSQQQQKQQISFNRKPKQQNQIQQRNFCYKIQQNQQEQQQQHKFTTFSSKFYRDLQKMSKYLLSLLVIFNMLPLFYAECDQTFVSRIGGPQNGTFSAPFLHNHKNHSRQCLYTFLAGPGQRVEVIFKKFNLRGNPPDGSAVGELPSCVHEYMDIYSEVQSSEPAELINSPFGGRYCGTIPPRQRISMYRAIAISFFTNKNITTPDLFEGTFRFINASEYEIGIPIAGSPCSYTITPSLSINKTGVLISPTYPGAYPKDMSCTYQFLGESNQRVRLEFRDFDLFFGGPHCPFDYVKVYDGPDNSSALIGAYCGQQRNLVLYSSESSLFVHFFTLSRTANTQNRGFKGIYEFSESFVKLDFIRENDGIHIRGSECDQKILSRKESTGFVLSPNYPYPYIPKTVCRYFIYGMQDAQHLERVRLEFTAFNIPRVESKDKDKETNCSDGYLKIYLKGQETADAYDKFDYELCGNETQRVVSDGPRLAMVFSSGELQGRGFKGKYVFETEYKIPGTAAPDGSCSFTYVSSSKKRGELNSPRYPSNYPSDTNCSYLFLAEPNEQVTIVFDHFKIKADGNSNVTAGAYGSVICYEDWLEMYVVYRDNNDRFLGRYCGMTAPGPVESPRGAVGLRITLHTDQENVASGFKARYFFETAKSEIGDCGGNFSNEDSGIITSPNYPAGYKAPGRGMASMACNWIMTARPGYKLSIHFEQFSLEGDPTNRGCPAAVLRLWVNVDSDQPPLELCGEKPPIEQWHYISTGQTARISFTTSDKTVGAQGFRIVWTEIQDSGPGPPSIGLLCESTYHFQCEVGYCISDKLRCDGVKNCGPNDDSDELHCESYHKSASGGSRRSNYNNTSRRLVPNLSPMHTLSLQKKT